jgi:hypothetical protein
MDSMRHGIPSTLVRLAMCLAVAVAFPDPAAAQAAQPSQPPAQPRSVARPEPLSLRGIAFTGISLFGSADTFEAVLGSSRGPLFGGGLNLTERFAFVQVAAWRYSKDGERVFVGPGDEVFPLGIPARVEVTPLEISGGWHIRGLSRAFLPYVGGGVTVLWYEETSDFADAGENVDERFTGYHLLGGIEVRLHRLIGLGGEVAWTSVPDAIGDGGASAAFDEDNLGGTSVRIKVIIGR